MSVGCALSGVEFVESRRCRCVFLCCISINRSTSPKVSVGAGTVVEFTELFSGGDKLSAVRINLQALAVTRG